MEIRKVCCFELCSLLHYEGDTKIFLELAMEVGELSNPGSVYCAVCSLFELKNGIQQSGFIEK